MAKRDPEVTAGNKVIDGLSADLRAVFPAVLAETGISSEQSLNAPGVGGTSRQAMVLSVGRENDALLREYEPKDD